MLNQCHPDIRKVLEQAIKITDFQIICGYRDKIAQREAYQAGFSKAEWGDSAHNYVPSFAVDLLPYPFQGWDNKDQFYRLAGCILTVAHILEVDLVWGGDFKRFFDGPHFEIRNWKDISDPASKSVLVPAE